MVIYWIDPGFVTQSAKLAIEIINSINNPFGNQKNTFYYVWAPRFFASETQERKEQHFAALWTLFTLNLISMNSVEHTVQE
jgi:hypothetical protein